MLWLVWLAAWACDAPRHTADLTQALDQQASPEVVQALAGCLDDIVPIEVLPPLDADRPWMELLPPRYGQLHIQGLVSRRVPLDQAYLFQRIEGRFVLQSAWVDAGQLAPTYLPAQLITGPSLDTLAPQPRWPGGLPQRPRNALLLGLAGGLGLGAGSLYGLAWQREQLAISPSTPQDQLASLKRQNNALLVGSTGLSALALSSLSVALFRR